jgi:predicted dinucleotide-binding enzyme
MKIAVLGTGVVGQAIGAKLADLGHEVMIGTRDAAETLARQAPGQYGQPPFSAWLQQHPGVRLGSYAEAAAHGEVVVNATNGMGSLDALRQAGEANLNGKVLIDISNPLDFSHGMPPSLFVSNTDSLAEQIQRAFPRARVVKTLNTVTASLMVDPGQVAGGEHTIFLSGNDPAAKAQVAGWLATWFGWKHILDLGDISTARGVEMYLPLWLRLWGALGSGMLNIRVVS